MLSSKNSRSSSQSEFCSGAFVTLSVFSSSETGDSCKICSCSASFSGKSASIFFSISSFSGKLASIFFSTASFSEKSAIPLFSAFPSSSTMIRSTPLLPSDAVPRPVPILLTWYSSGRWSEVRHAARKAAPSGVTHALSRSIRCIAISAPIRIYNVSGNGTDTGSWSI